MMKLIYTAIIGVLLSGALSGCYTISVEDANRNFKDEIGWRPDNPFIEHPAIRDLEDRIQKIVKADISINNGDAIVGRNAAILENFAAYYDHVELEKFIRLSRAGIVSAAYELYGAVEAEEGCEIDTNDAFFKAEAGEKNQFDWTFQFGECEDGVAHGIGYAGADGLKTQFVGWFDKGKMVEGVFERVQSNGKRVTQVGGVSSTGHTARFLTSIYSNNGFQSHRYGDFDDHGNLNGFFINIHNYTNEMRVTAAGSIQDNMLEGFGAKQQEGSWGDGGRSLHVWIGVYKNDKLNGFGAWTNGTTSLIVGEWENGELNGVGYRQYSDYVGDYRSLSVGRWENGKRHGPHKSVLANSFNSGTYDIVHFNRGELTGYDSDYDVDFTKIFAIAAGAAMLSVSDIPSENAIEIGTALTLDVINDTGGSNLTSLQNHYASQLQTTPANNSSEAVQQAATADGLKYYDHSLRCESGTQATITIPYRTDQCRKAAIDFAETYSCNKLDQQRVMVNCQKVCGHPQCLEN
jgi:hypothetical protein